MSIKIDTITIPLAKQINVPRICLEKIYQTERESPPPIRERRVFNDYETHLVRDHIIPAITNRLSLFHLEIKSGFWEQIKYYILEFDLEKRPEKYYYHLGHGGYAIMAKNLISVYHDASRHPHKNLLNMINITIHELLHLLSCRWIDTTGNPIVCGLGFLDKHAKEGKRIYLNEALTDCLAHEITGEVILTLAEELQRCEDRLPKKGTKRNWKKYLQDLYYKKVKYYFYFRIRQCFEGIIDKRIKPPYRHKYKNTMYRTLFTGRKIWFAKYFNRLDFMAYLVALGLDDEEDRIYQLKSYFSEFFPENFADNESIYKTVRKTIRALWSLDVRSSKKFIRKILQMQPSPGLFLKELLRCLRLCPWLEADLKDFLKKLTNNYN